MRKITSLLSFILLSINCLANGTWNQVSIYSGGPTDQLCSFSIGSKGYVGGGRDSMTTFKDDFWEFDPITNAWTQIANYPGGERCALSSFVINDKAYVGLGFDLSFHDDFYEYDPLTNIWTPKATFPGGARYSVTWFTIGNSGYIVGGYDGSTLNDCWEYTPSTDTWLQKADFAGGDRQGAVGFAINGMGYACGGYDQPNHFDDLWQFDPVNNTWAAKASFPGSPRRASTAMVLNNEGYVGLGYDGVYQTDFYKYNPTNDSWVQQADFGGLGRYLAFSFEINNIGYIGAGSYGSPTSPLFTDDVWIFEPSGNYSSIEGHEFIDYNSNSIQDSIEPALINKKVIESTTGNIAFTNPNGFYSLVVYNTGNFDVSPFDSVNYFSATPANYSVNFTSMLQVDSLNDFAYQPVGIAEDLCISISPTGNFRSGMDASYILSYTNYGNTTPNASVVFYPDTNLTFLSSAPGPTSVTPDSIEFSIGNLAPFQSGQILIEVNVDLGLSIGTLIHSSALILPIANDLNPACNTAYWDLTVTGSYDPNDIMVSREFLYDYEVPNQPELEYLIRFQNTGNDTAFTVRVMNPIDTIGLDINSIEFVASSHPASMTWLPAEGQMKFLFNNILLVDSNMNESMSHGFIRYSIKPKANLVVGDSITSQAFIFFDFNAAVETNIAKTEIITPSGIHENTNNTELLNVYPNPVHSSLTIQINRGRQKNNSLEIYNVYGQKVRSIGFEGISGDMSKTIDVSDLSSGIYFIKVLDGSAVKRFVKY